LGLFEHLLLASLVFQARAFNGQLFAFFHLQVYLLTFASLLSYYILQQLKTHLFIIAYSLSVSLLMPVYLVSRHRGVNTSLMID